MEKLMQKLSSRKLWAMVLGVASGLAMTFGLDQTLVTTVAGAVTTALSIVAYIVAEGKIDAAAVKKALEAAEGALKGESKDENQ